DPLQGGFDGLAPGGADGPGVVEPLAEELPVATPDLVDLEPLPEPLVEVAEVVELLGSQAEDAADGLGGADDALTGAAVERREIEARQSRGEFGDLSATPVAQGDVENALDAVLLVVGRRAGADQNDLGHSRDGAPAVGAGTSPRWMP